MTTKTYRLYVYLPPNQELSKRLRPPQGLGLLLNITSMIRNKDATYWTTGYGAIGGICVTTKDNVSRYPMVLTRRNAVRKSCGKKRKFKKVDDCVKRVTLNYPFVPSVVFSPCIMKMRTCQERRKNLGKSIEPRSGENEKRPSVPVLTLWTQHGSRGAC
mgnify:CR=1 FL=1